MDAEVLMIPGFWAQAGHHQWTRYINEVVVDLFINTEEFYLNDFLLADIDAIMLNIDGYPFVKFSSDEAYVCFMLTWA